MGRKKRVFKKKKTYEDPVYHDSVIARFINRLMRAGKKGAAERILYDVFNTISGKKLGKEPLEIFKRAVENCKPFVVVRSRRVGGATYQVPMEVRPERRQSLAIRWLITYAQERKGKSMHEKLSDEIIDAYNGTGGAIRKKEDVHKMAEANKAFAHYRW